MAKAPKIYLGRHGTLSQDQRLAAALGEMVARWSLLEYLLIHLLKQLTNMEWHVASAIIFAVNATSARTDITRIIAERLEPKDPKRAAALEALLAVSRLAGRRNALVHHVWFQEEGTGVIRTADYRLEPRGQGIMKRQTARGIYSFCDDITDACAIVGKAAGMYWPDEEIAAYKIRPTTSSARKSAKG